LSGPYPVHEVADRCHQSLNQHLGALKVGFEDSKIPDVFTSSVLNQTKTARNKKEQAYLIRAFPAPGFRDPDFFTAQVTNEVLGGGMSSRFFRVLRDEKSYGYEVGSRYQPYLPYGILYSFLGTDPARVDDASRDFQSLIEEIQNVRITEDELSKARNLVISRFSFAQETLAGRASMTGAYLARDMGLDFLENYVESTRQVTPQKVQEFAQKYFSSVFEQRVHP